MTNLLGPSATHNFPASALVPLRPSVLPSDGRKDSNFLTGEPSLRTGIVKEEDASGSGHGRKALSSRRNSHPQNAEARIRMKELWQDFFADPSQWWDNRFEKSIATYPDFKHKRTHEPLWLNNKSNPPWVEIELAAMVPGPIQLNLYSWNKKLKACIKTGQHEKALELFYQMQCEGITPDKFSFVPVFNSCASLRALDEGRQIHSRSIDIGCDSDLYVGNSLIDMYSKCGKVDEARSVFDRMPGRDVVSWNAMLQGYVKSRQPKQALKLSTQMQLQGLEPNAITFVALLNACASLAALEDGRRFHEQLLQSGFDQNVFVGNSLIDMYAKCGSMEDAQTVFTALPTRTVVAWSAMIHGFVKCGLSSKALGLYKEMQGDRVVPNSVTFAGVLNACACLTALEEGRMVHREIVRQGLETETFVGNSLVDMYGKCGSALEAWEVFSAMRVRSEVSWNAMLHGFVECGQGERALELARRMQSEGVQPNEVTFVGMLKACVRLAELEQQRRCHELIIQQGRSSRAKAVKSLVQMYTKSGNCSEAWRLFNEQFAENSMNGNASADGVVEKSEDSDQHLKKKLKLMLRKKNSLRGPQLLELESLNILDPETVAALEEGRWVHRQIIESGVESDVVSSCLVDMYTKCGSMEAARKVFDEMPTCNVVAWSSMIQGYVKWGQGRTAMGLARRMQNEGGVVADRIAYAAVLSACGSVAAVGEGRVVHEQVKQRRWECDFLVGSSLVDMYAKCGSMEDAWRVFEKLRHRTVVAWSAIILGCLKCGQRKRAVQLFRQLLQAGVEPDLMGFSVLLNVCCEMAVSGCG